jgi:fibronectin-binding autotransporter adhesin
MADTNWVGTTGDFQNPANWSNGVPSQIPGSPINNGFIDNGGTAVINSPLTNNLFLLQVGYSSERSGNLLVTGAGRANVNGSLIVGNRNAVGTVTIESGAQLVAGNLPMAADFGSRGTVNVRGSGSSLQVTSTARIGGTGAGTLNVEDGASFNVNGTVNLAVEYVASATINVGNGTAVSSFDAKEFILGGPSLNPSPGIANLNFSQTNTLTVGATMTGNYFFLNPAGTFNVNQTGSGTTILTAQNSQMAGRYTVTNGKLLVNGRIDGILADFVEDEEVVEREVIHTMTVNRNGTLGGTGFIKGATTVGGQASETVTNPDGTTSTVNTLGGTLAPGSDGIGVLSFGTDLALTSGATLHIELGGTVRGISHDALNVEGNLIYGGTLRVSLANGFIPMNMMTFDLFDGFDTFAGTFESILFDAPGMTGTFTRQTGVLTVTSVPEPSVAITALVGLAVLGLQRRRTRN